MLNILICIIKGLDWGMDGYMWLARNQNNMCGIAFEAYSPILFVR